MRRFITILIIILIVASSILVGAWLFSRNTATKNGTTKPTFRAFITGESGTTAPGSNTPGSLSSEFEQGQQNETGTTPGGSLTPNNTPSIEGSLGAPGTQVSTFTNDTYNPSSQSGSGVSTNTGGNGTTGGGSQGGTGTSGGGQGGTGTSGGGSTSTPTNPNTIVVYDPQNPTTSTGSGTPTTTTPTTSTTLPQCSEADVTIVFTPAELAELKELERRFYTIAESIRTDEDLTREVTNRSTFKIKETQILELLNYCQQKTPLLANPVYKRRVPTPFWMETDAVGGFILDGTNDVVPISNFTNFTYGKRRLEYSLRLNLW